MKSSIVKRTVFVSGRKTSISIEDTFWSSLKEIARARRMTLPDLMTSIDAQRVEGAGLSSSVRVCVLKSFKDMAYALSHPEAAVDAVGQQTRSVAMHGNAAPVSESRPP